MSRLALALLLTFGAAAPALAQEETPPRFLALEQQQADIERQRFEDLDRARRDELLRPVAPTPNANYTPGEQFNRLLEIDREIDRLRLEKKIEDQHDQRERDLAEAALPNARIPASSSLVIHDPNRFTLPRAPDGQYYARIDGRFVLVDSTSQLVVKVLERQPTDPVNDTPVGGAPPPQAQGLGGAAYGNRARDVTFSGQDYLPRDPLPKAYVGPNSPLVIKNYRARNLGAPPEGTYYAEIGDRIYLVDANSGQVSVLIRKNKGQ